MCIIFSLLGGYDAQCIAAIALYMLFRVSEGFSDLFYGIMQKNDRLDTAGKFQLLKAVITTAAFSAGYFSVSLNAGLLLMSYSSVIISFAAEMPAALKLSDKTLPSFSNLIGAAEKTLPVFIYQLENSVIYNSFMSFGAAVVTMRRRFDLLILSHGAAAAVSAVSSVLFAKLYGISGASFGMTAASVTALIFMLANPFPVKINK